MAGWVAKLRRQSIGFFFLKSLPFATIGLDSMRGEKQMKATQHFCFFQKENCEGNVRVHVIKIDNDH